MVTAEFGMTVKQFSFKGNDFGMTNTAIGYKDGAFDKLSSRAVGIEYGDDNLRRGISILEP